MESKPSKLSLIEGTIRFYTTEKIGLGEKIIVTLLIFGYIFFPIDLIPDMIPVIGWLDDIGISCLALAYFNYRIAKVETPNNPEKKDKEILENKISSFEEKKADNNQSIFYATHKDRNKKTSNNL